MASERSPYVDRHGFLRRCFRCGCYRNHDAHRWDWLECPPGGAGAHPVSHGLCEPCFVSEHGELTAAHELPSPGK